MISSIASMQTAATSMTTRTTAILVRVLFIPGIAGSDGVAFRSIGICRGIGDLRGLLCLGLPVDVSDRTGGKAVGGEGHCIGVFIFVRKFRVFRTAVCACMHV